MWFRLFRLLVILALFVVAVFYAPRWWQEHAREQAATELSRQLAEQGPEGVEASLDGERVRLTGRVAVSAQRERAQHLASRYFAPEAIANEIVVAPPVSPYRFSAQLDEGKLRLQGYAPGVAARESLLAWMRSQGFVLGQDRLKLAEGAPADWARSVRMALSALQATGEGDVELAWRQARLRGQGTPSQAWALAKKRLAHLQQLGYETSFQLIPVLSCIDRIRAMTASRLLHFEAGEAAISPDSEAFLDDLAEVARSCPQTHFTVHGHTDNRGDPQANLALSQQRAEAVIQALVERGIAADRFDGVGHGSALPIADNDTEEGRAKNRRIEFTVDASKSPDEGT